MKFNPYAVLLTTGALMLATVLFSQMGSGIAPLKVGAVSVDRDVSGFAAKTLSAGVSSQRPSQGVDEPPVLETRVASTGPQQGASPRQDASKEWRAGLVRAAAELPRQRLRR